MTQEEIIKLAQEAGFENYAYEAAGIFERFARLVSAAEREKFTNTQEFVTLPREVVEQALEDLEMTVGCVQSLERQAYMRDSIAALSTALEQPQDEREPSSTAGMNIAQRILHIGGRNNAAWYVEFGSIQAVEALVRQVLRDLPQHREPMTDAEIADLLIDLPVLGTGYFLRIARAIEAAHNIK